MAMPRNIDEQPQQSCLAAVSIMSALLHKNGGLYSPHREIFMSDHAGVEHHHKAAEHHEHAARHHREAAKHHEEGNHETEPHHAHTPQGPSPHATHHATEAAKPHVEHHGQKAKAAGA